MKAGGRIPTSVLCSIRGHMGTGAYSDPLRETLLTHTEATLKSEFGKREFKVRTHTGAGRNTLTSSKSAAKSNRSQNLVC